MKQRIVIIDKDVKIQTLLESYLTEYEMIGINDYVKAVDLCKKAAPDLIIIGFLPKNDLMQRLQCELSKRISLQKMFQSLVFIIV